MSGCANFKWPPHPRAMLVAGEDHPKQVTVGTPTTRMDVESKRAFWSLGGASKDRVRILEDDDKLFQLQAEYTVGIQFQISGAVEAVGDDYDSLLLGADNKHWLGICKANQQLCCVDADTGKFAKVPYCAPVDSWVTVFLKPSPTSSSGNTTSVITFDAEGMLDVGVFDISLRKSSLRTLGWASSNVKISVVGVWDRCFSWSELASCMGRPPLPLPEPAPPRPRSAFRGRVVDINGDPLDDVKVSCGKACCFTNDDGCFDGSLSDAETDVPEDSSVVSVAESTLDLCISRDGYAPTCMQAKCHDGETAQVQITLRPISAITTMDPAVGGTAVDDLTGSSITVPPNTLVYPDGSPVEGEVTVQLSVIDVADPASLASMPGDFSAISEDGSVVFLQSLGAAWIGAFDSGGKELAVRSGSEGVALDLKSTASCDPAKLDTDPEMWVFNENSGKWELEDIPMKVNGTPSTPEPVSPKQKVASKGRMRGKKKMKAVDGTRTDLLEGGCMTADAFRKAVSATGAKSITTNLTKLGYINCDLAYHHPQRAVMLTGRVIDSNGCPVKCVQLWSVGKDYAGRTPDVTDNEGKFGTMIAQFDSSVDIEVLVRRELPGHQRIEVYFANAQWKQSSSAEQLKALYGEYKLVGPENGQPCWKHQKRIDVRISWNPTRRRWENVVGSKIMFVKSMSDSEPGLPYGGEWHANSVFTGDVLGVHPPSYEKATVVKTEVKGPFKTGPPGEFVDVGELVVD